MPSASICPGSRSATGRSGTCSRTRGGMNAEPEGPWWERNPGVSFDQLTAAMDESQAAGPADRRHHYSNLGYALLGEIVARLRGASWFDLVQRADPRPAGDAPYVVLPAGAVRAGVLRASVQRAARRRSRRTTPGRWRRRVSCGARSRTSPGMRRSGSTRSTRCSSRDTVEEMAAPIAADPREGADRVVRAGPAAASPTTRTCWSVTPARCPASWPGCSSTGSAGSARSPWRTRTYGARAPRCRWTCSASWSRYEPASPPEWLPEPELAQGEELLGHWYWGNTPVTMSVSAGILQLSGAPHLPLLAARPRPVPGPRRLLRRRETPRDPRRRDHHPPQPRHLHPDPDAVRARR